MKHSDLGQRFAEWPELERQIATGLNVKARA